MNTVTFTTARGSEIVLSVDADRNTVATINGTDAGAWSIDNPPGAKGSFVRMGTNFAPVPADKFGAVKALWKARIAAATAEYEASEEAVSYRIEKAVAQCDLPMNRK